MSPTFLTFYLLLWPLIVAGVLAVIVRAFVGEMRAARKAGRSMI
ncbi:putative transporter small subunit [Paracoccus sp. Z118]|nr:putative transporter small subunit [Paracoccus sp. Z118]MBV0893524.1 putative transporter small subunit [Paracoccus sp. Z118]